MKTRIITAIVLIALILPCVIIGQIPFQLMIAALAAGGVFEMLSICDLTKSKYLFISTCWYFYVLFFIFGTCLLYSNRNYFTLYDCFTYL